jgi:hypothetical protein
MDSQRIYNTPTTRDTRLQIQTALRFRVPYAEIQQELNVTRGQISYAKLHLLTLRKSDCGRKSLLKTPERNRLQEWIERSPSHKRIAWKNLPRVCSRIPGLENAKYQAISTALRKLGYCRRTSKQKGFSDNPDVWDLRLQFAEKGLRMTKEDVMNIVFSDEVWAMGGAHTTSFVTVQKDGSDRYDATNLQHKYSKAPAWMFHGTIYQGKKGPAVFWEKEWKTVNSERYDQYILPGIQTLLHDHPELTFQHDNAPAHRSAYTQLALIRRGIKVLSWPPWSPDLNLIEHVWNWMKNWIQWHYWEVAYYKVNKIPFEQLRSIISSAWEAVPEDYIEGLVDSWWRRC